MTLSACKSSPLSCVLNLLTIKPALEKHLSEEADVSEMQNILKQVASNLEVENLWTTILCASLKN